MNIDTLLRRRDAAHGSTAGVLYGTPCRLAQDRAALRGHDAIYCGRPSALLQLDNPTTIGGLTSNLDPGCPMSST
eukprot:6178232-Heterocapsa_arctica.AAC.1